MYCTLLFVKVYFNPMPPSFALSYSFHLYLSFFLFHKNKYMFTICILIRVANCPQPSYTHSPIELPVISALC